MKLKQTIKHYITRLDKQDRYLSTSKRKAKWSVILMSLFLMFVLSFIQPSKTKLKHYGIDYLLQNDSLKSDSSYTQPSLFELPVDSFEQLLNQQIHEHTTQKK